MPVSVNINGLLDDKKWEAVRESVARVRALDSEATILLVVQGKEDESVEGAEELSGFIEGVVGF